MHYNYRADTQITFLRNVRMIIILTQIVLVKQVLTIKKKF